MPVKTISVRQCDKPWITEEIKQMIRNKNKLHKKAKIFNTDQLWKSFRQIRNDLTYAIRKRKLDYLQDLDNRASSSATFGTKNWWKLVKSFMSNKGSDPDVIPPLEKDGVTYYTNEEKATILNQFFINQSTIEDNDDVPDVPELLTSINQIRVSTESRPWRRKFSRRSSRDSNPRPFNHESGALTTELSPPPFCHGMTNSIK